MVGSAPGRPSLIRGADGPGRMLFAGGRLQRRPPPEISRRPADGIWPPAAGRPPRGRAGRGGERRGGRGSGQTGRDRPGLRTSRRALQRRERVRETGESVKTERTRGTARLVRVVILVYRQQGYINYKPIGRYSLSVRERKVKKKKVKLMTFI